jgi:hypothetical protein
MPASILGIHGLLTAEPATVVPVDVDRELADIDAVHPISHGLTPLTIMACSLQQRLLQKYGQGWPSDGLNGVLHWMQLTLAGRLESRRSSQSGIL